MVRVASLPDLSRFVRRSNKLPIYNTIHLFVGTESIEVSGCVLSLKSNVFEKLASIQKEVYLDQFAGEIEGVQDCVELMYGGDVELNLGNITTVIKFSVLFEIEDVYKLGMEWVKDNLSGDNLFGFIKFGLLIESERVGKDNRDLLDFCRELIRDDVRDDLSELSKTWSIGDNINVVKFLIQTEIFYHTLPVLTMWSNSYGNDANVSLILKELHLKGIGDTIWKFGKRSVHLLENMGDKAEMLSGATTKELINIQTTMLKACVPDCNKNPNSGQGALRSDDYHAFDIDKVMALEDELYDLTHFQFVEILLDWIMKNKPSQSNFNRLWGKVRQKELSLRFLQIVHVTINHSRGSNLTIPELIDHASSHEFLQDTFMLIKGHDLSCVNISKVCLQCGGQYAFKMKLVDTVAGYELVMDGDHITVDHCHISWDVPQGRKNFSLLTNTYHATLEKVSQSNMFIEFAYNCMHRKGPTVQKGFQFGF